MCMSFTLQWSTPYVYTMAMLGELSFKVKTTGSPSVSILLGKEMKQWWLANSLVTNNYKVIKVGIIYCTISDTVRMDSHVIFVVVD